MSRKLDLASLPLSDLLAELARRGLDVEVRECEVCGKPFVVHRSDQRHCSPACRVRASRERAAVARSKNAE